VRVSGSTALVTGASRGIGRALALALAGAGADVALAARSVEGLERVAEEVRATGRRALVVPADVTDREQAERIVRTATGAWGRVDVVVANAGHYLRRPATGLTAGDVRASLEVNFFGCLHPILAALPQLLEGGRGHIVLLSSLDGRRALPGDGPYAIAKAAQASLAQVLRQELRPHGIGVTGVFPGRIDTEMIEGMRLPRISKPASPERLARAVVRAVERDRPEVVVPRFNRALLWADLASPRLTEWAIGRLRLSGDGRG
jgi:NADP-dependent 3-hydroxy acid dehydrogenase YdfG